MKMTEEELEEEIKELSSRLQKTKKQRDIGFAKIEGMIEGVQLGKLDEMDKIIIDIIELIVAGEKDFLWYFIEVTEFRIGFMKFMISTLKRITNLENEVKELKQTLDKLSKWK